MKRRATVHSLGISDEWRRWIAENLMLGHSPATLAGILGQSGIPAQLAQAEISAAMNSPYLHGVQRLHNRLAKRDWLLGIQSRLNRMAPQEVPRRERLSTEAFLHEHYLCNRPVIITGMLDDWPARGKWTLDWLAAQFGEREVEVQFGRNADADYEMNSIAHKRHMPFGEYVERVRSSGSTNDFYMPITTAATGRRWMNYGRTCRCCRNTWMVSAKASFGLGRRAPSRRSIMTSPTIS
jgi:hypothetical protein